MSVWSLLFCGINIQHFAYSLPKINVKKHFSKGMWIVYEQSVSCLQQTAVKAISVWRIKKNTAERFKLPTFSSECNNHHYGCQLTHQKSSKALTSLSGLPHIRQNNFNLCVLVALKKVIHNYLKILYFLIEYL